MKKHIYKILRKNKIPLKIISVLLVFTLISDTFSIIRYIKNSDNSTAISVSAADYNTGPDPDTKFKYDSNDPDHIIYINLNDLVDYSKHYQQYPAYHQNDTVRISTTGSTVTFLKDFKSLGNETYPFAGSISLIDNDRDTLALDVPLFDVVNDTAVLNGANIISITRIHKNSSTDEANYTPLIANRIKNDSTSGKPKAIWTVNAQPYKSDSDLRRLDQFAGFIGTMDNSASLTLNASFDFTDSANQSVIMESKTNDIGIACGTMGESSSLSFSLSITNGASSGAVTNLFTRSGNAGGFVGRMANNASLTVTSLSGTLFGPESQIYTSAASSNGGFAGGIVGKNDLGSVTMPNNIYTVSPIISGIDGAGGIYGYYKPDSLTTSFSTDNYLLNFTLNGSGNTGGLFGYLYNDHNFTINCNSSAVTTAHQSGSASCYGGIIGKYDTDSIEKALTVNNAVTSMTRTSPASNYGGGIGIASEKAYVKFDNLTINSASGADSGNFGGAVASAAKGYIDVNGISFTEATSYKGGGVVGALGDGILKMTGTIDLSNASTASGGQIVGTRDNALVYADNWTFTRSSSEYDNIGSWGDVLVFSSTALDKSNVLTETAHTVTVTAPATSAINSKEEFAKTALGIQIDYSKNPFLSGTPVANNAALTFSSNSSIDLTGTGLKGLTRDNTNSAIYYKGTINGSNSTVILDIKNIGNKPMYRHKYNGLIGITDGAAINNLNLAGNIILKANENMYAGAVSARAKNSFTASGITCSTVFEANGSSSILLGRLLGEAMDEEADSVTSRIGTITINKYNNTKSNTFSGNITSLNSNTETCLGGVIGKISHKTNASANWSISDVTLSGTIQNTSGKPTQRIGGLIAEINGYSNETADNHSSYNSRELTLKNISINNLTVDANLGDDGTVYSSGGLLGYSWLSTDVTIGDILTSSGTNGITVTKGTIGCKSGKANCGDTAGLVYQATGKWTVKDVKISDITLNSSSNGIRSFGVLVDKGWYSSEDYYKNKDRQALYLSLPKSHTYTIGTNNFSAANITDFDELLTYSAYYEQANDSTTRTYSYRGSDDGSVSDIMVNGQAVVSYNNNQTKGGLKMESSAENSKTYTAKTERGKTINPYSRYYYNLDTIVSGTDDADKLMKWGLHVYSCANLKKHFTDPFEGTIPAGTYDMKGYSWYPVNIDGSVTVNGTFKLYNKEFEQCEAIKNNSESTKPKMLSLPEGTDASQHYMLHNGLIHNVTGALNIGNVTLQGNVGATSRGSGALVCGIVKGDITSTAQVKPAASNNISLDGVYIHNLSEHSYAPLLINRSGSYTSLQIHNVSTTTDYNTNNKYKAATSLVGNAGNNNALSKNVNVEFKNISLDGRSSAGTPALDLSIYNTTHSIFTRATLLNSFMWTSGSKGTYNYNRTDDWNGSTHLGHVTYGSEISDNTNRNQYYGEEFWYNDQEQENRTDGNGYFTDYSRSDHTGAVPSDNSAPVSFSGFLPYVYDASTKANVKTEKKYQLEVNHAAAKLTGCGTYNDPYVVHNGDFETIANILSGNGEGTIRLPVITGYNPANLLSTRWHTSCEEYKWNDTDKFLNASSEGYDLATVREYLAGAYYKIPDGGITLSDTFKGLGSITDINDKAAVFRGVIIGNGNTITNKSNHPLIVSSYGCVIKDVDIVVSAEDNPITTISKTETAENQKLYENKTDGFYGAVIGQIFGGDNIIDNVTVQFTEGKTIKLDGNNKQLIPVGGYVGVVYNGGLIFRGMEKTGAGETKRRGTDAILGIPSNSSIVKDGTNTDLVAENNTKWLYVNPIVGRVLNGYAITEADAYRPFEDGTRTYSDGSKEYWQSDGTIISKTKTELEANDSPDNTMKASASAVTMRNGSKHYSITDINKDEKNTFVMSGIDTNSNINISSAQALYIMSLITQSGLGKSNNGHYSQTNKSVAVNPEDNYLTPYNSYMSTHLADYSYVGNITGTEPTSETANPTDAQQDYINSKEDKYSGYGTDKLPHIIKTYTNTLTSGNDTIYPAFDAAGDTEHYFNLILNGTGKTFHLPDSYRGLGSLMFGIENPFMHIVSSNNDDHINLDNFKENVVFLYSFNGGNNTVSLNMKLLVYEGDNYPTLIGLQANFKTGFSLINCLQADYSNNNNRKFKDLTIMGNIKSDLISKTSGKHVEYSKNNVGKSNPAVAAFVGVPVGKYWVNGTPASDVTYDIYLENITVDSMELYGMCHVGGFIGAYNVGGELSFMKCSADDLKIFGGGSAGGLMGLMRHNRAKVTANFENKKFGIISIKAASLSETITNGGNTSAGGMIGTRLANSQSDNENINIKNVIISNGTSAESGGYIGCFEGDSYSANNCNSLHAGGILGNGDITTIITADNVTVKNLNICGKFAGGMIGSIQQKNSKATIINSNVITDTEPKCRIESTYDNNTAGSGGFVGHHYVSDGIKITDSKLIGYTVSGYKNVGGVFGLFDAYKNDTNTKAIITNVELKDHLLKGNNDVGGLVGNLADNKNRELNGYNILIKNQYSEPYTDNSITNNGFIVGNNANNKLIKLVGFSRQGNINAEKMIGTSSSTANESYGLNGYVIFADYNDEGSAHPNNKWSNVKTSKNINVSDIGDHLKTTTTDYVYSATRTNDNTTIAPGDITDVSVISSDPPHIDETGEYDISIGQNSVTSYSGTRIRNDKLEGFYLSYNDQPKYFSNTINNNGALDEKDNIADAAVWYFEPYNGYNKIYTIINSLRNYIKTNTGNNIALTTDADNADLIEKIEIQNSQKFYLKKKDDKKWLQHSGTGKGIRYWTDITNLTNSQINITDANVQDNRYFAWIYDDLSINGTNITSNNNPSLIRSATDNEIAYYNSKNPNSYNNFEIYYITETVRENVFADGDNTSPYVTTSPKTDITNTQWLTGDGLRRSTFVDGIDHDRNDTSNHKRYQTANTAIGTYDTSKIISGFSNAFEEFGSDYGGKDFHMLILEDTTPSVTTNMIVNYLRLLTNTNYNFKAQDYNEVSDESSVPFKIVRKMFSYNNGAFVMQDTTPTLQYNPISGFYMEASYIDSSADIPQFTLMDVQFFDPNDSNTSNRKVAYHLYVPVYTRKVIQFRFNGAIASGTDYFDPYPNQTLFENLGTPFTLKLTYSYDVRTNDEWKDAINNGECVMGNYFKSINLSNENYTWKNGTKFALVDTANNGKVYYNDHYNGSSTDQVIEFKTFTDDESNTYEPLPLYDILNVVVSQVDSGATLVMLKQGDDISTATVYYNGHYYKPKPENYSYTYADTEGTEHTITYSDDDVKYSVTSVSASPETYYLSIFTPKSDENEPVHHFSFKSPDKLSDRTNEAIPQSKIKGTSAKIDLYTGNIYENTFHALNVTSNSSNNPKITESNNSLTVNMKATLELTQNAKDKHIYNNLANATSAAIYQTFLMTYSMKSDENGSPKLGIQPGSSPDVGFISYDINESQVTGSGKKINKTLNYIEFANGVNLKSYLEVPDGKADINMSAVIEYDPGNIVIQFPPNTEGADNGVGTNVIAYSKIASSVDTVANSPTLKKRTDNTLYFSDISSSATLTYMLDFEKSGIYPAGIYNDLGINAFERTTDTAIIKTEARYDTSKINSSEDYVELTIRLSKKSAYAEWLPLGQYLKSVKVYGADGTTDLLSATNSDDIKVTKNSNEYIIRAKKSMLQKEGDYVYIFPITLEVNTGNTLFNSNGLMYSNYMVKLTAELYGSINGNNSLSVSHAEDHLIYTNARMDTSMM